MHSKWDIFDRFGLKNDLKIKGRPFDNS